MDHRILPCPVPTPGRSPLPWNAVTPTTPLCVSVHARDPERPRPAADGAYLCAGCIRGMERHLARLPDLHADVVDSMPTDMGGGGGTPVSGSRTPRLPVNLEAGEMAGQIEHDVRYWVDLVAGARGLTGPMDPRMASRCAWLGNHVEWLAASGHAAEIRAVLAELVAGALQVISPTRRPIRLGPCVEVVDDVPCDGTLRATVTSMGDRPAHIWCDTCPLEVDTAGWFRFGQTYASGVLVSSSGTAG